MSFATYSLRSRHLCLSEDLYSLVKTNFTKSQTRIVRHDLKKSFKAHDLRPAVLKVCSKLQDIVNDKGNSLLHVAVWEGQRNLVRLLLEQGYDACNQNTNGNTALHLAMRINSKQLLLTILKQTPDLLIENGQHETSAEYALRHDHFDSLSYLLARCKDLTEIVPETRKFDFLISLLAKNQSKFLAESLTKVTLQTEDSGELYSWTAKEHSHKSLKPWLNTPASNAKIVFDLPCDDWDLMLYHIFGKKALWYIKDRPEIHEGSYDYQRYIPLLWLWRAFSQSVAGGQDALSLKIDQAIATAIKKPGVLMLCKLIKEGSQPVILTSGWRHHAMTIVCVGDLLFLCNRGRECPCQKQNISAYRFQKSAMTTKLLREIFDCDHTEREKRGEFLYKLLLKKLHARQDDFCRAIEENCQPSDQDKENCTTAAMRLAIQAIMLCSAEKYHRSWDFGPQEEYYKRFSAVSRLFILQEFLNRR